MISKQNLLISDKNSSPQIPQGILSIQILRLYNMINVTCIDQGFGCDRNAVVPALFMYSLTVSVRL